LTSNTGAYDATYWRATQVRMTQLIDEQHRCVWRNLLTWSKQVRMTQLIDMSKTGAYDATYWHEQHRCVWRNLLTWATQVRMTQLPGKKWNAISSVRAMSGNSLHHPVCPVDCSALLRKASRLMQLLGTDCVFHFTLRVAAKSRKQWKMHKLEPTPDLLKYNQLATLSCPCSAPQN